MKKVCKWFRDCKIDKKTKSEKLFVLLMVSVMCVVMLCLAGCNSSCLGCNVGCENNEGGCASGIGYTSEGCATDDSCISTCDCVDFEKPYNDDSGDVLLMSCETVEDGCGGESGCYNGTFCGGCGACGTCGIFYGEIDGYDVDETTIGCINGCSACGDSDGMWSSLLEKIYDVLDLK